MAVKSILDVEVKDEAFNAYFSKVEEYNKLIGQSNTKWVELGDIGQKLQNAMGKGAGKVASDLKKSTEEMKKFNHETKRGILGFGEMSKKSKSFGMDMKGLGSVVRSIGGAFGVVGEVVGVAAMAGIAAITALSKMSGNIVKEQTTGRGLGMSVGQLRAYNTDYGRYDPGNAILGAVGGAQLDITGQTLLSQSLGMSLSALTEAAPSDLTKMIMLRAHDFWKSLSPEDRNDKQLAVFSAQYGVPLEPGTMKLLGKTPRAELERAGEQYKSDISKLNVSNESVDKWYSLNREMELAGKNIESVLVDDLGGVAGKLAEFTTSVVDATNALTHLSLLSIAKNILPSTKEAGWVVTRKGSPSTKSEKILSGEPIVGMSKSDAMKKIMAGEKRIGMPAGMGYAMFMNESGLNPTKKEISHENLKHAMGVAQFIPSTAAEYGLKNRNNESDSIDTYFNFMADLHKKNVKRGDSDMAAWADASNNYQGYPSGKPKGYTSAVMNAAQQVKLNITVNNQAGANVTTSINAAGGH